MNLQFRSLPWTGLKGRFRGMFNLNDPRWGRGDDNGQKSEGGPPKGPNQGPPDLDELWRDFNRKLGGLFGGKGRRPDSGGGLGGGDGGGGFQPDMRSAGIGAIVVAAVVVLIWLGTGFFIVQEGQQAVITQFGKYHGTVEAGFNWRLPWPIQRHETVNLTQLRSVEIGRNSVVQATGLKESSMLTQDENIVDVRFTIQYRLKNAAQFLFENRNPDDAVIKAAESAIREVVGRVNMDDLLGRNSENIQRDVAKSIQVQMDRYKTGIEVQNVNIQNVQPPEQVQAAFDDALKAGQDRDRLKNEGQAYANDVIPRAKGAAARLKEESDGYSARIVAQAEGDAQRFRSVLAEYQKAPQVTRDRMYIDAMQQVYSSVTKVLVDSRQGNSLLYLPLDKLIQQASATAAADSSSSSAGSPAAATPALPASPAAIPGDSRARDNSRTRDRETR
ncbi:FtsH protease activity modulator HflK [Caenimonas terrae]|uniref:Protein HflK n=1 Tax=Caenimonas terrae TaxID=696074 RepID=A0ABW0NKX6_9BURK